MEGRLTCDWQQNLDWDIWDTTCGHTFQLTNDEGPHKNNFIFCCYCGGILREKRYEGPEE